jgi:hypothetical protein
MGQARSSLEKLGVLIGRASTQRKLERMFVIVGAEAPPRIPQDMIETRRIPILR